MQVDFGDAFLLLDDLQRMGEQHAPLAPAPLGRDALLAAAAAYQHMFPAAGDATALRASFEMTSLCPTPRQVTARRWPSPSRPGDNDTPGNERARRAANVPSGCPGAGGAQGMPVRSDSI